MKKSNVAIYIVVVIFSALLLWIWFALGLDYIDYPLDLIISIIWWCLVLISCIAIYYVESRRQRVIRTTFIAQDALYNPEKGVVAFVETGDEGTLDAALKTLQDTLSSLKYSFKRNDPPEDMRFVAVVRSKTFKERQGTPENWEGEVAIIGKPDEEPIPFTSREELAQILKDVGF